VERAPAAELALAAALALAAGLALGWGGGCGPSGPAVTEGTLTVVGSETAKPIISAAADSFVRTYKKAHISVEGGGTVVGIEALINRQADVAVLSREPSEEERAAAREVGVEIFLYAFAVDGLAIVVHHDNPVYALSFAEARGAFSGTIQDWAMLGGAPGRIRVYVSGVQTGARGFVQTKLLGGAPFVEGAGRAPTTAAVVDSVASHADAIGFAGMAELDERVKALPISPDGGPLKVLNVETVYRKEYPLGRVFYLGTRGIPRDNLVSGFVSFVMSTPGQRIVLDAGFVPATVPLRIKREG
jgi:phosphate transport system substrate-binding protein